MAGMALTNAERQRLSRERRAAGEQTVTVKLGDGTTVGVRVNEVKTHGMDRAGAWVATRSGAVHRLSKMQFDELSDLCAVHNDLAEAEFEYDDEGAGPHGEILKFPTPSTTPTPMHATGGG